MGAKYNLSLAAPSLCPAAAFIYLSVPTLVNSISHLAPTWLNQSILSGVNLFPQGKCNSD